MNKDIVFTVPEPAYYDQLRLPTVYTRSGLQLAQAAPPRILDETTAPPRVIAVQAVTPAEFYAVLDLFMDWNTNIPSHLSFGEVQARLTQDANTRISTVSGWTAKVNSSIPVGERWKVGADLYVHPLKQGKVPYTSVDGRFMLARIAVEK